MRVTIAGRNIAGRGHKSRLLGIAAIRWAAIWVAASFAASAAGLATAGDGSLAFKPTDKKGIFQFDTGQLTGTLKLDGRKQGIDRLIHVASGIEVTYGGGYVGLLSPYRVFCSGKRFGHAARDWPSQPSITADGAVKALFPPEKDHPLELVMTYRWISPDTLEFEVEAKPQQDMPKFELFMSSYFAKQFAAYVYLQPNRFERGAKPRLMPVKFHPLFAGNYMIFPRDRNAALIVLDGRWDMPPNPVQWCITRWMAGPLAVRQHRTSGLTAVLMAPPSECFAVATPYDKTPPDGVAGHRSLYFCLFGQDVKAGRSVKARMRLVVSDQLDNTGVIGRYQTFLKELK